MYLDFIKDLVKIGDSIILCCKDGTYEGFIVKINNDIIAIRQSDDSILLKEDKDITDIKVNKAGTMTMSENESRNVRHGMILVKIDKSESFHCSICNKDKVSKKYAIEVGNPNIKICNSCYGWTLARLDGK